MKNFLSLDDLAGQPAFSPPGHQGTVNHRLAWSGNGATHLAVWHGEIAPGGEAQEHSHPAMDQAFCVLGGRCSFRLGAEERSLGPGGFVFVPQGVAHRILSTGTESLKLLVIVSPPPPEASLPVWQPHAPRPKASPCPGGGPACPASAPGRINPKPGSYRAGHLWGALSD